MGINTLGVFFLHFAAIRHPLLRKGYTRFRSVSVGIFSAYSASHYEHHCGDVGRVGLGHSWHPRGLSVVEVRVPCRPLNQSKHFLHYFCEARHRKAHNFCFKFVQVCDRFKGKISKCRKCKLSPNPFKIFSFSLGTLCLHDPWGCPAGIGL